MSEPSDELRARGTRYGISRGLVLEDSLGYGKDGAVFCTSSGSAVKVYHSQPPYQAEKDCYLRLAQFCVDDVLGFHVPEILDFDNTLLVVEMTMVKPPYILDFASARLDEAPDFPPEVLEQWEQDRYEEFGPHWPRVRMIIQLFKQNYRVHLLDVHPRNISFEGIET